MITLFRANNFYSLKDLPLKLTSHINQLVKTIAPTGSPLSIFRYEFPTEKIDLFSWLHNQKCRSKLYWADRSGEFKCAGIGTADTIEGSACEDPGKVFEYIEDRLADDNTALKYYGGFRFSNSNISDEWNEFPAYKFIIPRFEFYCQNNEYFFALNIAIKDITEEKIPDILKQFNSIDFNNTTAYREAPKVIGRQDTPTREDWENKFNCAVEYLRTKELEKIVLARKSVFKFNKAIDPIALTKHLADVTPSSFHFCFQSENFNGFIGATPERLFKLTDTEVKTEALAGTISRQQNPTDDKKNAEKLLVSDKNKSEHNFVVNHINNALENLCSEISFDENPGLLKLTKTYHLITEFNAKPTAETTPEKLLKALHPTPAVAGIPQIKAEKTISEIENFDRGWYCGPVGYIGRDTSEFAVAIRSALIKEDYLSLYAGAGIVEGSECEEEWQEIEAKISNFISVFKQ